MMSNRNLRASGGPARWSVRENRFVFLLAALTVLLVSSPLLHTLGSERHPMLAGIVFAVAFTAMLLAAVFAVGRSRSSNLFALLLAIPVIVLQVVRVWRESDSVAVAAHIAGLLFLVYTVILILKFLFSTGRVSSDMICASLCIYLLLGVLWAITYSLIQIFDGQAFLSAFADDGEGRTMQFGGERTLTALYYSFVTMSTLGYGDIVPRSSLARMAAAMQAIVGQLYLAVLVARLVGLHIVHATEPHTGTGDGHETNCPQ